MAGKTYTQKIQFQGTFDGAEVLSGLKKIRQSMSDAGADASLFKGVDKDIAQAEKLVTDLLAQIQKGFSNPKEIANFEKQFEKLGSSLSKINVGLQGVNEAGNFNLNPAEIQKYTKELDKLTAKQGQLEQAARDSIAAQLDAAKLTQKERQAIMDEVEAQGDLEAAIKKVAQAKEKAAKAKHGTKAMDEGTGREYIDTKVDVGLTADDVGATAKKGNVKRGKDDARARNAAGNLIKSGGENQIDELKTNIALQESYKKALEEVVRTGGTADDAVELMKKSMGEYGIELTETIQLLYNFQHEIEDFYTDNLSSQQQAAITRTQSLGRTNIDGEFELSQQGQDIVNNADIQAAQQNLEAIRQTQEQVNAEIQEGEHATEQFVQEQTQGLQQAQQAQENLEQSTKESTENMKEQSEAAEAINNKFDDMKQAVKTFLSIGSAISAVRSVISQTFNDVKELDKSFANIAMVTDYSVQEMWDSYGQYAEMANELGQSTQSVIEASGLFYQQGLDTAESLALTEDTMKLATLAGLDFTEATSQMTAALRGFKMEMDEGARVTDVYSELAAKAAADVEGISYAMTKTASIAESAGMAFETTSAFLTQMIETTQEAPENIGTAMKTIIARFTELKTNVAGSVDSEFDDLDYNKVDTALKSVGVSIKDANGQFRNLDEVFIELSSKWNTLDRNTQRYIATIAAGSRQQSRFIAMMDNYERTMELVDVAYNSAGKSSEQFAKYQDTLEYKLNQLSNTWEQFRIEFFNSEFFKNIVDGLNGILEKITDLNGGELLGLGAAFIVLGKTLIPNLINVVQKGMFGLGSLISKGVNKALHAAGKPVINLEVKIKTRELEALKEKQQELIDTKIAFEIEKEQALKDLEVIQQKMEEMQADAEDGITITFEEAAEQAGIEQEAAEDAKEARDLQEKLNQELLDSENQILEVEDYLGDLEQQEEDAQTRGEAIGGALISGLSLAMAAVTTQDNPIISFLSVLGPQILSMMPSVVSAISAAGGMMTTAFWTSTAGIGIIISLIIAALAAIGTAIKNAYDEKQSKKFENQIDSLNDKIEKQEEKINELKNSISELDEEEKTLEEITETYNKLGKKINKTTEEQEEYNSMIEILKSEFPELITYYNEENNALQINIGLLQQKTEELSKQLEEERRLLALENQQNIHDVREKDRITKVQTGIDNDNTDTIYDIFDNRHISSMEQFEEILDLDELAFNLSKKQIENGIKIENYTPYVNDALERDKAYLVDTSVADGAIIADAFSNISPEFLSNVRQTAQDLYNGVENIHVNEIYSQIYDEIALQRAYTSGEITQEELENFRVSLGISTQVIEEFSDEIQEYNSTIAAVRNDLYNEEEYYLEQYSANKTVTDFILGSGTAASDLASGQAAFIQKSIFADGAWTYEEFAEAMREANIKIDEVLSQSVVDGMVNNISEWHWQQDEWEDISTQNKALLNQLGIEKEDWADYVIMTDKQFEEAIKEKYGTYLETQIAQLTAEGMEIDQEALNKDYSELMSIMTSLTKEQFEKQKNSIANKYGIDESVIDISVGMAEINKSYENLAAYGADFAENMTIASAQTFSNLLDSYSFSQKYTEQLVNKMEDIYKNNDLTTKQMSILTDIDLSQGYFSIQQNATEYITNLRQAGMSAEEATKVFNDYIESVALLISKNTFGKEGAQIVKELLQEDIKSFSENYQVLFDARDEMLESGELSTETYFKLMEAGFEEFVDITSDGYVLLTEKAEDFWSTQAMAPLESLRASIKQNKKTLAEAEKFLSNDYSISLTNQQRHDLGLINDQAWNEITKAGAENNIITTTVDINSIAKQYKQALADKNEALANKLYNAMGADAAFIEKMVSEGYDNLDEYIIAIKEGLVSLESQEAETWIQGLVSLQKASIEAQEKVNDLKEELADLEEQLIEDQKAVDEAAQALHEAKFGTEDFQSGLDGLINYERPLELINKQLENLKENLTDVSTVEDASAAMNQIAGLYKDKIATLQAEGKVIDQSLANIRQELLSNYGEYISFDENGIANVDFSYENMQDSDIIKTEGLEKLIEEYNSTYDMALDKEQEYLDAQKEFDELKSEARDKYITMEQNVIDIIKEQMQEEIDAVTDKYAALEEADNNYLDALQEAIDKQRELRDQENQYEDLATKEKRLALMQRDTSGANQKEVLSLEQEIEDDRQNLLDNEIDNLIDSMKELYDKQKEARDLEIEAMEAATENMQLINETALNIISGFETTEDYQAWLLENDTSIQDMTTAQTEQYLEEAKETFSGYAQYAALTTEEIKLRTDEINQKADEMFTNTSENITNIGTIIQDTTEKAKQDAIDEAQEAYDNAVEKMNDTQTKITETKQALEDAEDAAVIAHGAAMDEMVKASQAAMLEVATAGAKMMIEAEALDLSNSEEVQKFAKEHNFYNEKTGEYSQGFVDALTDKGYDTSNMVVDKQWQITGTPTNGGPTIYLPGTFDTKAEAEAALPEYLSEYGDNLKNLSATVVIGSEKTGAYKKYAAGGLVDYTGPAWVDGAPNKPEAFLNPEDTKRIGAAAKLLADLPIFNKTSNAENAVSTNIGDTSIEIHINVESISDDYDVDQMIERVKQDIVDVAKPIGTSVILNK